MADEYVSIFQLEALYACEYASTHEIVGELTHGVLPPFPGWWIARRSAS